MFLGLTPLWQCSWSDQGNLFKATGGLVPSPK
jgi:hypothetical protein